MRRDGRTRAINGEVRFLSTPALQTVALPANVEIRRISAEQSNSSLVIGDLMVLKVIRKLSKGVHPEAEMGRFLTLNGFENTPAMLGEVSRCSDDGERYTLMVLQRFIHNQGDGWQWTLNTLARAGHGGGLPALDASGGPSPTAVDPMLEFTAFATMLGQRLGQMHSVLATPDTEPAFVPETATDQMAEEWAADAWRQVEAAFAVLENGTLDAELAPLAQQVLDARTALHAEVQQLAHSAAGALRIRIHGDFHLGQVLVSSGDVWLVDFEGEPAKPLEERRAKASPWRDVAGLLRSFDYAAAFAKRSDEEDILPAELVAQYLENSQRAFLEAYRAAAPAGARVCADELLRLFTLQKAAYEVCYEAANRPTWLGVPLQGLARLAAGLQPANGEAG
jgi:maltose alpha-D-glucosyltransferase/alpha-amylase